MLRDIFTRFETAATQVQRDVNYSLYVQRRVMNPDAVFAWLDTMRYPQPREADLHVTVAYSTTHVNWSRLQPQHNVLILSGDNRRCMTFGETNVFGVTSAELQARWRVFRDAGCSWDFPNYNPHVSVGTAVDAAHWNGARPFRDDLVLGPELFDFVQD